MIIKHNRDYVDSILENLKSREPELYKDLTRKQVLRILNLFTTNIVSAVNKRKHVCIFGYMNLYPNAAQLFAYRVQQREKDEEL